MSRPVVSYANFAVKSKEDLYTTITVKVGTDYHGCGFFDKHTPFGVCKNIEEFESYLDMLSNEEIINYRDCYGGTILHDMAEANLTTDYFEKIIDRIGEYNFIELLEIRDRGGNYAISNVQNLELFKYLVSYSGIDDRMLRRISQFCSQPILTYLADIINDAILFDD